MAVGKGRTKLKGGIASKNEAVVINGAVLVTTVRRVVPEIPSSGYGAAQLKGGIASKGEVLIINGAFNVRSG